MELATFIEETLTAIVHGVQKANSTLEPGPGKKPFILINHPGKPEGFVDFDVAVTTGKEGSTGGSGGIRVAVLSASAGGESKTSEERISRIRFRVAMNAYIA